MTENLEEGYLDGLAGRDNRMCSPNYIEGWELGNIERNVKQETLSDET